MFGLRSKTEGIPKVPKKNLFAKAASNKSCDADQSASEQGENARFRNHCGFRDNWRCKSVGNEDEYQNKERNQFSHGEDSLGSTLLLDNSKPFSNRGAFRNGGKRAVFRVKCSGSPGTFHISPGHGLRVLHHIAQLCQFPPV
jgi:hypothetical protein